MWSPTVQKILSTPLINQCNSRVRYLNVARTETKKTPDTHQKTECRFQEDLPKWPLWLSAPMVPSCPG